VIEVLVDESVFQDPPLTLAGAVVFQHSRAAVDQRIRSLHQELCESFFLDGERSFEKFRKRGFHAADDLTDISTAFVRFIGENPGAKLFIEYSDHTLRPDLSVTETIALLQVRLVETILRKYRRSEVTHFTFEQNQELDKHYEGVVRTAVRRSGYSGRVDVQCGAKMDPPALSVVDYALVACGRTRQARPRPHDYRTWKAMRPMVSSVRSLDGGGVDLRRGLLATDIVSDGEGASS